MPFAEAHDPSASASWSLELQVCVIHLVISYINPGECISKAIVRNGSLNRISRHFSVTETLMSTARLME